MRRLERARWGSARWAVAALLLLPSCGVFDFTPETSPFRSLIPIAVDGSSQQLRANVIALGAWEAGQSMRINVTGTQIESALVLLADEINPDNAFMVGGGAVNASFDYPVRLAGTYFLFVQSAPQATSDAPLVTVAVESMADTGASLPARQFVRVTFADDYLTDPGLFDPVDGTEEERELLRSIESMVAGGILDRLQTIFADSPIVILADTDPDPGEPVSILRFVPDRVESVDQDVIDAALPAPDPTRPECQTRVIFGEVLPRGSHQDVGNRNRDDEAEVYVGSFQGRGSTCRTAAINSVNTMVLLLAQTGAHEIGHLVGLYHIEQVDLMNRTATLAFQRELTFARGQIQLDRVIDGEVIGEVVPAIVQDPTMYFAATFELSDE